MLGKATYTKSHDAKIKLSCSDQNLRNQHADGYANHDTLWLIANAINDVFKPVQFCEAGKCVILS